MVAALFLKAKRYTLLVEPDDEQLAFEIKHKKKHGFVYDSVTGEGTVSKAKGVMQTQNTVRFEDFYETQNEEKRFTVEQRKMQTKDHCIHWTDQTRVAFDSFDDKRYVLDCGSCSKAYGSIKNNNLDGSCDCNGLGK